MKQLQLAAFVAVFAALSMPLWADGQVSGDPEKGTAVFRKCQACHVIANDAGDVLAGRKAKIGPNLYGIASRPAGSVAGFNYSKSMLEAGEAGLVWDEATFVAYVMDPSGFLKDYLGETSARSKMTFRLRDESDLADLYAYIAGLE